MIKTVKKIEIIKTIETMRIELTQAEAIEIFNSFSDKKRLKIFKRALKSVIGKKEYKRFKKEELKSGDSVSSLLEYDCSIDSDVIKKISKKLKTVVEKKDYFPTLLMNIKGMKSKEDKKGYIYKIKNKKKETASFVSSLLN